MKHNFTRIVVLVDRSGSMSTIHDAAVAGINEFISVQKSAPGDAKLKIVQFDDNNDNNGLSYDVIIDSDLKSIQPITGDQYQPRGWTPLYDAMGRCINELGAELSALPESERAEKVIVCVVTDGYENRSKEHSAATIKAMVEHQTEKYLWNFTYVGANQDAILVGAKMGIVAAQSMTFSADAVHTKNTFRSLGNYANRVREASASIMKNIGYTQAERSLSLDTEDDPSVITPKPTAAGE